MSACTHIWKCKKKASTQFFGIKKPKSKQRSETNFITDSPWFSLRAKMLGLLFCQGYKPIIFLKRILTMHLPSEFPKGFLKKWWTCPLSRRKSNIICTLGRISRKKDYILIRCKIFQNVSQNILGQFYRKFWVKNLKIMEAYTKLFISLWKL